MGGWFGDFSFGDFVTSICSTIIRFLLFAFGNKNNGERERRRVIGRERQEGNRQREVDLHILVNGYYN